MGFLTYTSIVTLDYETSKQHQRKSKRLAVQQFIRLLKKYSKVQLSENEKYKYGFELELHTLVRDEEIPKRMNTCLDIQYLRDNRQLPFEVNHEYGAWMAEMVPKKPLNNFAYAGDMANMFRCYIKHLYLQGKENTEFLSLPFMPKMGSKFFLNELGMGGKSKDEIKKENPSSNSPYMSDKIINLHPRFGAFTRNVRLRREENPQIIMPLFKDENTVMDVPHDDEVNAGEVHLDAFSFGMGLNCLQVTFSAENIDEGRWAYDQFHMWTPLFLALSAAMPMHKGKLLATDTRWEIISMSVDCRKPGERRVGGIEKSRYSSINHFISNDKRAFNAYNDKRYTINKKMKKYLKEEAEKNGLKLDKRILNHIAYQLVRDNLCLFEDSLGQGHPASTAHFEAYQSSNWNDVRFKPPPSLTSNIGWRVEFRTVDAQIHPDQNFLFSHAIQILYRMITSKKLNLNFYIPISLVDENFKRANKIGAVTDQKFYTRTNVFDGGKPVIKELYLRDIVNGNEEFIGLNGILEQLIKNHLPLLIAEQKDHKVCPIKQMRSTFDYLYKLSTGEMPTNAKMIRDYVAAHPKYAKDSVLGIDVLDDLTQWVLDLQNGKNKEFQKKISSFVKQ